MEVCKFLTFLFIFPVIAAIDDEFLERLEDERNVHSRRKRDLVSGGKKVTLGPSNGDPLSVVTIMEEPFTMWDDKSKTFIGMIPDLFNVIGYREKIKFTMYEVPDGRYGYKKENNQWTGMIGEIVKKEENENGDGADLVGAALTMHSGREEHISFINPFKHTGIVMLLKKIDQAEFLPVNFKITDPLSAEVWLICTAAVFLVGLIMFAINRLNPYEWSGRYDLGRASELHAETFNLSGSLWFAFTTFQWQGYERAPRSIAGRVLSIFWFTFITITLLTYTASLVNWLFWASTVHGKDYTSQPIQDLEHLVMSNKYKYGCVTGGSTYRYLTMEQRGEIYTRIKKYFESDEGKQNLVNSSKQGIDRVRKEGNYVFIAEELFAMHQVNKMPCDLAISGKPFAPRSYAMAYRDNLDQTKVDRLHTVILQLQEEGELEALEQKWFVDKGQCWNVSRIERMVSQQSSLSLNNAPKRITLKEYWGPFVLIIVGIIASIVVAVAETMYFKYKGRYQPGNRPGATQLKLEEDGQM